MFAKQFIEGMQKVFRQKSFDFENQIIRRLFMLFGAFNPINRRREIPDWLIQVLTYKTSLAKYLSQ